MADTLNFSTAFSGPVTHKEFEESPSYGTGSDTVTDGQTERLRDITFNRQRTHKD
jgi:hypothetical protein